MKKVLAVSLCLLLLLGGLALGTGAAEDVVYLSTLVGNDANSGRSAAAAKKTIGGVNGSKGALAALPDGGTIIIPDKYQIGGDYTMQANGKITITATDGVTDYKNQSPATNPSGGTLKFVSGKTLSVACDLTLDDLILFQENAQNTIIVKDGGSLTITGKIVCLSKQTYYTKIVVEKGGKATINGGIFSSVTGDGTYTVADSVLILDSGDAVKDDSGAFEADGKHVFIDYNGGSDTNSGISPGTAKKSLGTAKGSGAMSVIKDGGTLVLSGKDVIGGNYTFPTMKNTLTITSFYNGVDYKKTEPKKNPGTAFKMVSDATVTFASDVVFDDVILFQEYDGQNTIRVTNGATLTMTDSVLFVSNKDFHFRLELESGTKAILSEDAQRTLTIENDGGTIETYAAPAAETTVLQLTINSKTAYKNGEAVTLDAAPVIVNSSTMLPVRFVAENLGAAIAWDGATSTATLTTDSTVIVLKIGAPTATVNGAEKALAAPAFIDAATGRSYLPVRFIAENLGAAVAWDGATSTATLTK